MLLCSEESYVCELIFMCLAVDLDDIWKHCVLIICGKPLEISFLLASAHCSVRGLRKAKQTRTSHGCHASSMALTAGLGLSWREFRKSYVVLFCVGDADCTSMAEKPRQRFSFMMSSPRIRYQLLGRLTIRCEILKITAHLSNGNCFVVKTAQFKCWGHRGELEYTFVLVGTEAKTESELNNCWLVANEASNQGIDIKFPVFSFINLSQRWVLTRIAYRKLLPNVSKTLNDCRRQ